jgi:hypothetical protein
MWLLGRHNDLEIEGEVIDNWLPWCWWLRIHYNDT